MYDGSDPRIPVSVVDQEFSNSFGYIGMGVTQARISSSNTLGQCTCFRSSHVCMCFTYSLCTYIWTLCCDFLWCFVRFIQMNICICMCVDAYAYMITI